MNILETIKNEKPSKIITLALIFGVLAWLIFDTYKMFYPSTSSSELPARGTTPASQPEIGKSDSLDNKSADKEASIVKDKPQMKYFAAISYSDVFAATQIIKRAVNEEEAKLYVSGIISQRTLMQEKERLEMNAQIKQYEEQIAKSDSEIEKLGYSSIKEIAIEGISDIANPVFGDIGDNGDGRVNRSISDFDIQVVGLSQISEKDALSLTIMVNDVKYSEVIVNQQLSGGLMVDSINGKCVTISKNTQKSIFCLRGA